MRKPRSRWAKLIALSTATLLAACSNAAPPPPPPPSPQAESPAPPSPKEFKVQFAWGKSSLPAKERKAIGQAVAELHANPSAKVTLVGKTDRSGSEAGNMKLSQRRTEAVYKALVAAGVAPDRIDRRSVGEDQPEVPTAAGVREPGNRVVDILVGT